MGKKIVWLIVIGILIVGGILFVKNSGGKVTGNVISEGEAENLHEVQLSIEGMYCGSCAYGVESQIESLDGVVSADINFRDGGGKVLYDADKVSVGEIAAASTVYPASVVSDKGFE